MGDTRTESDSFGAVDVPADALWGAQTARSLESFAIGEQSMPLPVLHALAWIKWAAACVNRDLLLLDAQRAEAIARYFKAHGVTVPIYYQGFGEDALAVPTADAVDEARNRRAVYVLANVPPRGAQFPRAQWKRLQ